MLTQIGFVYSLHTPFSIYLCLASVSHPFTFSTFS